VEVKAKRALDNDDPADGPNGRKARAARRWQESDPAHIQYTMIFAAASDVDFTETKEARRFVEGTTL
jgi:hypothetical protein